MHMLAPIFHSHSSSQLLAVDCRQRRYAKDSSVPQDIVNLAKFVLSKFFQMAATNKKIFMELLFWKTPREAYELEHGYESYKEP